MATQLKLAVTAVALFVMGVVSGASCPYHQVIQPTAENNWSGRISSSASYVNGTFGPLTPKVESHNCSWVIKCPKNYDFRLGVVSSFFTETPRDIAVDRSNHGQLNSPLHSEIKLKSTVGPSNASHEDYYAYSLICSLETSPPQSTVLSWSGITQYAEEGWSMTIGCGTNYCGKDATVNGDLPAAPKDTQAQTPPVFFIALAAVAVLLLGLLLFVCHCKVCRREHGPVLAVVACEKEAPLVVAVSAEDDIVKTVA